MTGKWLFTVHTFMGDMRSHYDITVDGNVITGTATDAANGATAPIVDGTYNDGAFKFTMTIKTAVGEMTNVLEGTYADDKIVGTSTNPMGSFELDGVRE